jgi:hypothetical protein
MTAKLSSFVYAVVSFGFGIFAMYTLFSSTDYLAPFVDSCYKGTQTHHFVGVRGRNLDKFLCFITPFFDAALLKSGALGIASFMFVGQMFLGFASVGMIESGRKAATSFVYGAFLVYLIGQVIGIAVAIPCFWLPALIFNRSRDTETKNKMISPQVVFLALIANLLMLTVGVGLSVGEHPFFYELITAFQFVPVSTAFVILFTRFFGYPFEAHVGMDGVKATKGFYSLFAFLAAATWYTLIWTVWTNNLDLQTVFSVAKTSPESCALFLIYDGLLLSISGAFTVFYLDGIMGIVKYLMLTLFVGPGASFMLCASSRENALLNELEKLNRIETSKKKK